MSTVVLMYHRVAEEPYDPFGLAVRPDTFADQISSLQRHADVVPLSDVLRATRGPRVAVTFDDGYADNLHHALAVLEHNDVPATFFVTSGTIGSAGPLWPLRLERLLRATPRGDWLDVTVGGRRLVSDVRTHAARRRALWFWHERLRPRAVPEIDAALDVLAAQVHDVEPDDRRMLTAPEVRTLAHHPLATVGAHTRTHPWLASLPAAEQQAELAGSRDELERITGRPVDLFAYPYGARAAYCTTTVRAARRAGFRMAFSTRKGPVVRGTSRFRVPRIGVTEGPEPFEQRLTRWLAW